MPPYLVCLLYPRHNKAGAPSIGSACTPTYATEWTEGIGQREATAATAKIISTARTRSQQKTPPTHWPNHINLPLVRHMPSFQNTQLTKKMYGIYISVRTRLFPPPRVAPFFSFFFVGSHRHQNKYDGFMSFLLSIESNTAYYLAIKKKYDTSIYLLLIL